MTTVKQAAFLDSLGLSRGEIAVYSLLLSEGKVMTARDVSSQVRIFPSAVYRLFYDLEALGLVRRQARRPKSYVAVAPETGFVRALELKRQQLEKQLTDLSLGQADSAVHVDILVGRQALYDRYEIEAAKAQATIDVHSIGIAFSDSLYETQRSALQRGVRIRHVVQQYKPANYHVLRKWRELGVQLCLLRAKRGFHMMVFDDRKVIVSFSNEADTDDRLSIITSNETACRLFASYFQTVWLEAEELDV